MKTILMLPAIVLGAASLTLSASALAASSQNRPLNPVTGLATGVLNAGGAVISGVGNAAVSVGSGVAHGTTYFARGVARTTTGIVTGKPTVVRQTRTVHGKTVHYSR